jgi:hypothetical protein
MKSREESSMKPLTITFRDNQFHIEDYPNAEKLVRLDHPDARRFTGLALHQSDLDFAIGCLEAIDLTPPEPAVIREALWRSAIIHVLKCFDDKASRLPALDANTLYGGEAVAVQVYDYFKKLRNKHLIHDENAWIQCQAGIVLNKKEEPRQVADVSYFALRICTLNKGNFGNLMLLATKAREWVLHELDRLHEVIMADLASADCDALRSLPDLQVHIPTFSDLGRKK